MYQKSLTNVRVSELKQLKVSSKLGYLTESIEIEKSKPLKANTIGVYESDELQQINFEYEDFKGLSRILYKARPSCQHEIEFQLAGGIRCIKCNGWYCA